MITSNFDVSYILFQVKLQDNVHIKQIKLCVGWHIDHCKTTSALKLKFLTNLYLTCRNLSAQSNLQESSKFTISIRDMDTLFPFFIIPQCTDDITKC